MEMMATKFPDIYHEFLEPLPSTSLPYNEDTNKNMTMTMASRNQILFGEYPDPAQHVPTMPPSFTKSVDTLSSCVTASGFQTSQKMSRTANGYTFEGADADYNLSEFADLDDILAVLEEMDDNLKPSTSSFLCMTKNAYGCKWTDSTPCNHGDSCPFINQFLGLGDLHDSLAPEQVPLVHNVVVLSQTPAGMVKLQESLVPIGQEEKEVLQAMTPEAQVRHLGLNTAQLRHRQKDLQKHAVGTCSSPTTLQLRGVLEDNPVQLASTQYSSAIQYSQQPSFGQGGPADGERTYSTNPYQFTAASSSNSKFRSTEAVPYKPPPNAVIVKIPSSSLQYHPYPHYSSPLTNSSVTSPPNMKTSLLCTECDTQFHDSKTLGKHTRNQHNVYRCEKCGEKTVGYYRMASHNKKNHSKEPIFFCMCGRTFAEKRGLTKHQNTCTFYKN